MTRKLLTVALTLALLLAFALPAFAAEDSKPCPWTISGVQVGKWANGNHKAGTWISGSFPIPPGVSERPTWYINGTNVGHSQIHFNMRWIPNSSGHFQPGTNTVTVKFLKPPYNGASNSKTITGFNWDDVPNGGYKMYR